MRCSAFRHCRVLLPGPFHLWDAAKDVGLGTTNLLWVFLQPFRLFGHLRQCLWSRSDPLQSQVRLLWVVGFACPATPSYLQSDGLLVFPAQLGRLPPQLYEVYHILAFVTLPLHSHLRSLGNAIVRWNLQLYRRNTAFQLQLLFHCHAHCLSGKFILIFSDTKLKLVGGSYKLFSNRVSDAFF